MDPAEIAFLTWVETQVDGGLSGLSTLAGLAHPLPVAAAAVLGVSGLAFLLAGARWPAVAGAVAGALAGAIAGLVAQPWLAIHWPMGSRRVLASVGALLLGLVGGAWPRVGALAIGAVPGAILGVGVPIGGSVLGGGAAGAAILGALALVASDTVLATAAAVLGAGLLGGAGLALLGSGPLAREIAGVPTLLVAWLAVVGAAGVAAQRGGPGDGRRDRPPGVGPPRDGGGRLKDQPLKARRRPADP